MKTAVEKLVEEINKLTGLTIAMDEPCVEQAKEMEKENIISGLKVLNITLKESYEAGQKSMYCGCYDILDADSFEDYVNGKFKQQEQWLNFIL